MYTIIRKLDGTFACLFRLQDGTEYYNEPTLGAAVKHAKKFARVMNGVRIGIKDITFLQERTTATVTLEPMLPPRRRQ